MGLSAQDYLFAYRQVQNLYCTRPLIGFLPVWYRLIIVISQTNGATVEDYPQCIVVINTFVPVVLLVDGQRRSPTFTVGFLQMTTLSCIISSVILYPWRNLSSSKLDIKLSNTLVLHLRLYNTKRADMPIVEGRACAGPHPSCPIDQHCPSRTDNSKH